MSRRTMMIAFLVAFILFWAGVITTFATFIHRDPGAALDFIGALLGAMFSVIGSIVTVVFFEREKSREGRIERRALLWELLAEVLDAAAAARMPEGDERFTAAAVQQHAVEALAKRVGDVRSALKWVQPDSAAMIRAFGFIERMDVDGERLTERRRAGAFYDQSVDLTDELAPIQAMARAAMAELHR